MSGATTPFGSLSQPRAVFLFACRRLQGAHIGVLSSFAEAATSDVATLFNTALNDLRSLGDRSASSARCILRALLQALTLTKAFATMCTAPETSQVCQTCSAEAS